MFLMKLNRTENWTEFTVHAIMLGILFFLPEALYSIDVPTKIIPLIHPIPYVVLFYINYFWLNEKFLFNNTKRTSNTLIYLSFNILLIIFLSWFLFLAHENIMGGVPHPMPPHHNDVLPPQESKIIYISKFAIRDIVIMVLTIALSVSMKLRARMKSVEIMKNRIETVKNQLELTHLKNQLNPHFLFNTLNNIYALIAISPEDAQKAIHQLSNLLRYVLYETSSGKVPLEKDINFIEAYINLMKMRLSSNVTLNININRAGIECKQIAPMLFITIIENAFKHGISAMKQSFINIHLYVEQDEAICEIENSDIPKGNNDKSGSGIGLANLQRQLDIIYPNEYSFLINNENGIFKVKLSINLQNINNP